MPLSVLTDVLPAPTPRRRQPVPTGLAKKGKGTYAQFSNAGWSRRNRAKAALRCPQSEPFIFQLPITQRFRKPIVAILLFQKSSEIRKVTHYPHAFALGNDRRFGDCTAGFQLVGSEGESDIRRAG